MFKVSIPTLGIEDPNIHQPPEPGAIPALHGLHTGLIALLGILMMDLPLTLLRARDTQHRGEHIPLTDEEGGDTDKGILELAERRRARLVGLILWQDLQRQQIRNSLAALRPAAGIDLGRAVIVEGEFPIGDVEAVAVGTGGEGELVPEAAGDADPGHAERFNLLAGFLASLRQAGQDALEGDRVIEPPFVGENVGDASARRSVDELGVRVRRRHDGHGDDQDLLTLEGFHKGGLIIVVYFLGSDAVRHLVGAVGTGESGDLMFPCSEQGLGDVFPYMATGLMGLCQLDRYWGIIQDATWGQSIRSAHVPPQSQC